MYAECQCSDFNHVVRFALDEADGDILLETRLNAFEPWWKRAWIALKYVLGLPRTYGHYDCTLLREEDYELLGLLFERSRVIKHLREGPELHLVGPQNNPDLGDEV